VDRIDFRSDTVTWPTPEMREAMASADLGDDVYGEDPTVNELEAVAAERLGKEAGLFVASGTMGNLIAILTHATRGDEAIVGEDAHAFYWEAGGMATLGGIVPRPLPTDTEGRMDLARVERTVRIDDDHFPRSRLILVENSYGAKGGWPVPLDYFTGIRDLAVRHGMAVHLDGARIFNAAVALDVATAELVRDADSVTFCLSKGLCAPVGSILCGSSEFVRQARRIRKSLGGGMRQAGVLAAAGLIAVRDMVCRLQRDHEHARLLAEGLEKIPGIRIEPERVRTNMVYFDLESDLDLTADGLTDRLRDEFGIGLGSDGPRTLRAVTHYWVGLDDVDALLGALSEILE